MENPLVPATLCESHDLQLINALENGQVLHFPDLPFTLSAEEQHWLDPAVTEGGRKNISLKPAATTLAGVKPDSLAAPVLHGLVARYGEHATRWAHQLFPSYRGYLEPAPTSLRLFRIETRHSSWRKDDSRLHVDAFPSRPNRGKRILRVFMNINPRQQARTWRIGEPFEQVARRFLPHLPRQWPGSAWLLQQARITKTRRTPYDHLMLALHDAMKADMDYQRDCEQVSVAFQPGSGWICFSDQTSHAAMSGQFMLEQTFFLPENVMLNPLRSPLATLQRLTGRTLI